MMLLVRLLGEKNRSNVINIPSKNENLHAFLKHTSLNHSQTSFLTLTFNIIYGKFFSVKYLSC